MKITFTPVRRDLDLSIARDGDTLIVNDVPLDFTALPEGAILPCGAVQNDWFVGDITRVNGVLCFGMILPYSSCAADADLSPFTLEITQNGDVDLPVIAAQEDEVDLDHVD